VRRIVGKRVVEADLAALRDGFPDVLLDVGTGDGKHALHVARQRPDWLVVGLDANRDNLARTARLAAGKKGQPNVVYAWAAAETLPPALRDVAEIHVLMPWGSLLRGLLGIDDTILRNLATAARDGARLLVTLNLHAWRPPVPEVGDTPEPTPAWVRDVLAQSYARTGWTIDEAHYADDAEIAALATAWSQRLRSSRGRFDVLTITGSRTVTVRS